ncbi:MAG TPA: hypothetical protein V6D22_05240 [Candidatus Obscuribacterales bacterium]
MQKLFPCKVSAVICALFTTCSAAWAQSAPISSPYDKLNLNRDQARQIQSLEWDWNTHYTQLQPRMVTLQKHLEALLGAPKADPIDITATQEHINQIREQLGVYATSTFLRKRRVLTDNQKQELDIWMRRMYTSHLHNNNL